MYIKRLYCNNKRLNVQQKNKIIKCTTKEYFMYIKRLYCNNKRLRYNKRIRLLNVQQKNKMYNKRIFYVHQ